MKPSLEAVVKTYQNHLYAAAFSVCKSPQDAEDVVQDTLLQYWTQKYVKLEHGQNTLYMTAEYGKGYTTSPHRYVIP